MTKFGFKGSSSTSVATYINDQFAALHFTGDLTSQKSDLMLRIGKDVHNAVSYANQPGYRITESQAAKVTNLKTKTTSSGVLNELIRF